MICEGMLYFTVGHGDPEGCLNITMSFYQYMDPHIKDKTVLS